MGEKIELQLVVQSPQREGFPLVIRRQPDAGHPSAVDELMQVVLAEGHRLARGRRFRHRVSNVLNLHCQHSLSERSFHASFFLGRKPFQLGGASERP